MKITNKRRMKRLLLYGQILTIFLLSLSYSCKKKEVVDHQQVLEGKAPANVNLLNYTNASISVGWVKEADASAYTVQLLGSKDSETPIAAYTTTSKDFYVFESLEETRGYYVRIRANYEDGSSEWAYIMDGLNRARIMPKFGFVAEDFVAPDPATLPVRTIYPNFPEGWEDNTLPHFSSYITVAAEAVDTYPSGRWLILRAQRNNGSTIGRKNTYGMMGQNNQNSIVGMEFDLPGGASKFSFFVTPATASDTNMGDLVVEYSVDSGNSWVELDRIKKTDGIPWKRELDDPLNFKEYVLDIRGNVRFRFTYNSAGLGTSPANRWAVDDVAVYQNIN